MVTLSFVTVPEWFDVFFHQSMREAFVAFRAPCGRIVSADLRVCNNSGNDGQWAVEIKTNGKWIPGVFNTRDRVVLVRRTDLHYN